MDSPTAAGAAGRPRAQEAQVFEGPLFVVFNTASGRHGEDAPQLVMQRAFAEAGRPCQFMAVDDSSQLSVMARSAVQRACAEGGAVVAAGGDGTINAVAKLVLDAERHCPFGVVPQGTFNYFGRANGLSQDTLTAARALLRARLRPTQVGMVNDQIFLVNASLGLYPELLEDRETYKQRLGRSRGVALLSGLRTLLREGRPLELTIQQDGRHRNLRTASLFIGNNRLQLEQVGLDQAGALAHQRLAAVVVRPAGRLALLGLALRGALGRLGDAERVDSFDFEELQVQVRGRAQVKVATDGEIHWLPSPLRFRVSPQPLMLLVPPPELQAEVA